MDTIYEQDSSTDDMFLKGWITVDNKLYGRYAGELQICLKDLPANPKVNKAGHVRKESESLLKWIGSGQKYIFLD